MIFSVLWIDYVNGTLEISCIDHSSCVDSQSNWYEIFYGFADRFEIEH